MANTIKIKHGSSAPGENDLQEFELGYCVNDGKLYIGSQGKVIKTDNKFEENLELRNETSLNFFQTLQVDSSSTDAEKNYGTIRLSNPSSDSTYKYNPRMQFISRFKTENDSNLKNEYYNLPIPDREGFYEILTSKNPVTISQGGTQATTAAQGLINLGGVPITRKINNKELSQDITLKASDIDDVVSQEEYQNEKNTLLLKKQQQTYNLSGTQQGVVWNNNNNETPTIINLSDNNMNLEENQWLYLEYESVTDFWSNYPEDADASIASLGIRLYVNLPTNFFEDGLTDIYTPTKRFYFFRGLFYTDNSSVGNNINQKRICATARIEDDNEVKKFSSKFSGYLKIVGNSVEFSGLGIQQVIGFPNEFYKVDLRWPEFFSDEAPKQISTLSIDFPGTLKIIKIS